MDLNWVVVLPGLFAGTFYRTLLMSKHVIIVIFLFFLWVDFLLTRARASSLLVYTLSSFVLGVLLLFGLPSSTVWHNGTNLLELDSSTSLQLSMLSLLSHICIFYFSSVLALKFLLYLPVGRDILGVRTGHWGNTWMLLWLWSRCFWSRCDQSSSNWHLWSSTTTSTSSSLSSDYSTSTILSSTSVGR